jgi:hypothetical protein
MGTRDDTVKHLGIRSTEKVVDFATPVEITAEIDWNDQANGCYLQASLFLCPTATDTTASSEPDWLVFEYVGVPPGRNARAVVARRSAGQLRMLFTEGWPDKQRTGRPIGRQHVVLRLGPETAEVLEDGKLLCGPLPHGCAFRQAFLYVEVCSHSNDPPRAIFFDNIAVRRIRQPIDIRGEQVNRSAGFSLLGTGDWASSGEVVAEPVAGSQTGQGLRLVQFRRQVSRAP